MGTTKKYAMKTFSIEIKWGLRYIFAYLGWIFLEKFSGVYTDRIALYLLFSLLFYVFAFVIYLLAVKEKRDVFFEGKMDWKQGCISGITLTVVVAVLMPLAQTIIHKGIAPEFLPNMAAHSLQSENADADAIKSYFSLGAYIWQSIYMALSIGFVYAAIVARFLRTKV